MILRRDRFGGSSGWAFLKNDHDEMKVILSQDHLATMVEGAKAGFPLETCGLLSGTLSPDAFHIAQIWPAKNIAADPTHHFDLDPAVRFVAESHCRQSGRHVIGHWHSHPNGRPDPSPADLAMAYEPQMVWVIVALTPDGAATVNAYALNPEATGFIPLEIKEH